MLNLKQRLLGTVLLLISIPVCAQVSIDIYKPDPRLYECLGKTYIDRLSADKSELIPYYNYYLDHSFYVASMKADKPVTGIDIHTVRSAASKSFPGKPFSEKEFIKGKFNPLKYNFTRALDGFTTYIWKEAGVALVFYPQRQFQEQFDDYLKKQQQ
jgi:hypothetical protein